MRVTQIWKIQNIEWIDPRDPAFKKARMAGEVDEPVGLTPAQLSHKSGNSFQVLHYISPQLFLDIVDPLFDPDSIGRKSLDFFEQAVEERRTFAPLQVWLSFDEYLRWPDPDQALVYEDRHLRYKVRKGETLTDKEHRSIVRTHEGRHRAWFSREIGETEVPVTVWVKEAEVTVHDAMHAVRESLRYGKGDMRKLLDEVQEMNPMDFHDALEDMGLIGEE